MSIYNQTQNIHSETAKISSGTGVSNDVSRQMVRWHRWGLFSLHGVLFTILVILVTSFQYIWVGAMPAWLITSIGGLVFLSFSKAQRQALVLNISLIGKSIFIPMTIFMLMVLIIDFSKGSLEGTFSKRLLLNVSVMVGMIAACSWSLCIKRSYIINLFAIIVFFQGVVCIAQYMGNTDAWDISLKIASAIGKVDTDENNLATFQQLHRVKGTNLYVHGFTPMQGMLVTYLISIGILNFQYKNPLKLSIIFLFPAIVVGVIGMVLTFSRSVLLGCSIAIVLIILSSRNFKSLFAIVILGGGLLIAESYIDMEGGKEFNRITDTSMSRTTNASRVGHLKYSLEAFEQFPLTGAPPNAHTNILVHSIPLRILVEYGLFGLLPYLATLLGLYRKFKEGGAKKNSLEVQILSRAGLYGLMVAVIDGWTHSSGFMIKEITQGILFGVFLGSIWPIDQESNNT